MEGINLYERHRWHLDPNRPPITTTERTTISDAKGALKRALNTVQRQMAVLARYADHADKPSTSGMLINASLKCFASAAHWLNEGVGEIESALAYAKKGE